MLSVVDSEKIDFSVVIPVYNSQATLYSLCQAIFQALSAFSVQIVLVNDSSIDSSWQEILAIKEQYGQKITAINLVKNAGQHAALFCGFHFIKGEQVVTIDDDLQTQPIEILKLIEKAKHSNADLVYGVYTEKKHSQVRNIGSNVLGTLFHRYASTPAKGSSFKLIRKELVDKVLQHNNQHVYIDEVLGWHSGHTAFVEVNHEDRKEGKSGYNFISLVKIAIRVILNYTILPLKMITYLGVLSSLISFGVGGYYIYQKYNFGAELGFTSLIVAIFFSTGLILLSLGIIGEYLNRIFMMQMGKPPFKIKTVLE